MAVDKLMFATFYFWGRYQWERRIIEVGDRLYGGRAGNKNRREGFDLNHGWHTLNREYVIVSICIYIIKTTTHVSFLASLGLRYTVLPISRGLI